MRDGIELEKQGLPSVTICWERFEGAARAQADALGLPQLPLAVIPEARRGETREDLRRKAEAVLDRIVAALTAEDQTRR